MTCYLLEVLKSENVKESLKKLDVKKLAILVKACKFKDRILRIVDKDKKLEEALKIEVEPCSCDGLADELIKYLDNIENNIQKIHKDEIGEEYSKHADKFDELYPEQVRIILDYHKYRKANVFIVKSHTGTGKTYAMSIIAKRLVEEMKKRAMGKEPNDGNRVLVIVPQTRHQEQWAEYGFFPIFGKSKYLCRRVEEFTEKKTQDVRLKLLNFFGIRAVCESCRGCTLDTFCDVTCDLCVFHEAYYSNPEDKDIKEFVENIRATAIHYFDKPLYCRDCHYYDSLKMAKNEYLLVANFANFIYFIPSKIVIIDEFDDVLNRLTQPKPLKFTNSINRDRMLYYKIQEIIEREGMFGYEKLSSLINDIVSIVYEMKNLKELVTLSEVLLKYTKYKFYKELAKKITKEKIREYVGRIDKRCMLYKLKGIEPNEVQKIKYILLNQQKIDIRNLYKHAPGFLAFIEIDEEDKKKFIATLHEEIECLKEFGVKKLKISHDDIEQFVIKVLRKRIKDFLKDIDYIIRIESMTNNTYDELVDIGVVKPEALIETLINELKAEKIFLVSATADEIIDGVVIPENPEDRIKTYNPEKNPIIPIPIIDIDHTKSKEEIENECEKLYEFMRYMGITKYRFVIYAYNKKISLILRNVFLSHGIHILARTKEDRESLLKQLYEFRKNEKYKGITLLYGDEYGLDINPKDFDVRFLIIPKIPFPNLATMEQEFKLRELKDVKKLNEENCKEAAKRLLQLTGRIVRDPNYSTVTFILDKKFSDWSPVKKLCMEDEFFRKRYKAWGDFYEALGA